MQSVLLMVALFFTGWILPEPASSGEIFRWRDGNGVVHFADRTDVQDAERITLPASDRPASVRRLPETKAAVRRVSAVRRCASGAGSRRAPCRR